MREHPNINYDPDDAAEWLKKQDLATIIKASGWTIEDIKELIVEGMDEVKIIQTFMEYQNDCYLDSMENKEAA